MSRIHLKLSLYMLWGTGWDSLFFTRGYPVILHPWLKTLLLPNWIILTLWKKSTDHISEDLFLDFLSVLTLYFPFYVLALFFLNIILASLGRLHFFVDFIIILSRKPSGILSGIAMNVKLGLWKIGYLTVLNLYPNKRKLFNENMIAFNISWYTKVESE